MNTITMTAKNEKGIWKNPSNAMIVALTKNPKMMAFRARFEFHLTFPKENKTVDYAVIVDGVAGDARKTGEFVVKTRVTLDGGNPNREDFRGVKFGGVVETVGGDDWADAIALHFHDVYKISFRDGIPTPVFLNFTKEVDRLDFGVRVRDNRDNYTVIDGFVARLLGTNRYYVNAAAVPTDWFPTEYDTFGKNKCGFGKWLKSEGHYTMLGAIRHHCETVWGVAIPETVKLEMPNLPTFVRIEATRKVMAIAMGEKFAGTEAEHEKLAKEFANEMVESGECFLGKCRDFPRATPIALFNFDTNAVLTKWDDLYGVKVVEGDEDEGDVEEVA